MHYGRKAAHLEVPPFTDIARIGIVAVAVYLTGI